jgi:hypothetical protein
VQGGQIKIGDDAPVALVQTSSGWSIDGRPYAPLPALNDHKLNGSYSSTSCFLASCSSATFTFRPDGTFTASAGNTYANTMANVFAGAGNGSSVAGTYSIEGHAITLSPQGGAGGRVFFFLDGNTIQIAEDWYLQN